MSGAPDTLKVHDVTYQTESGQVVTVTAAEMLAGAQELADCNGWSVDEMLANKPVRAGKRLPCLVVKRLPRHWRQVDSSGYIMMRFKKACTVRGQRFLGGASAEKNPDFIVGGRASCDGGGSMLHSEGINSPGYNGPLATPRRAKRGIKAPMTYLELSPSSEDDVGCTQWLEERYHRALFAATYPAGQLEDGFVLHACGNPKCAAVYHFYLGDRGTNALDTEHHAKKPKTSRIDLPRLQ